MSDESLLPHILDLATLDADRMPQDARKMARLSLFDWMVVSLAGADQPSSDIIRNFVAAEVSIKNATIWEGIFTFSMSEAVIKESFIFTSISLMNDRFFEFFFIVFASHI